MRRFLPPVLLLGLAVSLVPDGRARADLILNGDFSQAGTSPDAFASWTTTFGDSPTDGGGFATFTEGSAFLVELEQKFAIPANVHINTLSFEFRVTTDTSTGEPSGGPLDSFQAALYDDANNSFPSTTNSTFPAFYSIDIGGQQSFDSHFVSVSSGSNPGWSLVTLDLSTFPVPQAGATIEFILNSSEDGQTSIVDLDNVQIQSAQAVPEPSTVLPMGLGLIGLIAAGCWPGKIGPRWGARMDQAQAGVDSVQELALG